MLRFRKPRIRIQQVEAQNIQVQILQAYARAQSLQAKAKVRDYSFLKRQRLQNFKKKLKSKTHSMRRDPHQTRDATLINKKDAGLRSKEDAGLSQNQ
jgi:hypothetical protein